MRAVTPPPAHSVSETRLEVFVGFKPVNASNAREDWRKKADRIARERKAVERSVFAALRVPEPGARRFVWTITSKPTDPKRITFTVHAVQKFDDDALPVVCKAARDALQGMLIHDDGPDSGHTFTYHQVIDGRRGVTIAVARA